MFQHVFQYRLKCHLRDRQLIFWTLLFPIVMATLFYLAFSNLEKSESFTKIRIAIVNNEEFNKNTYFKETISTVSGESPGTGKSSETGKSNESGKSSNASKSNETSKTSKASKSNMFKVTLTSAADAEKLLENSDIDGYILFDKGAGLIVKKSGLNQSVIKIFMDDYLQTNNAVMTILEKDPTVHGSLMKEVTSRIDYIRETPLGTAPPDTSLIYFFALVAMTCIYGGFFGINITKENQADLSPQGARVNLAPVHKMKLLISDILAAFVINYTEVLILLAYARYLLKINLGNQWGYILLVSLIGCLMGISLGAMIGTAVKSSEGVKIAVHISLSMTMSFFSGMMFADIKYIITNALPAMAWINPANLLTDALYALYYYDTHTRFFMNLGVLSVFTVVFCLVSFLILRRQKYASI